MRNNLSKLMVLIFMSSLFLSCSNDDIDIPSRGNGFEDSDTHNAENDDFCKSTLTFIYEGVTYSSSYTIAEDSSKVFDDATVTNLVNKFKQNQALSILVNNDDIFVFDTQEEKESFKENLSLVRTKVGTARYPAYANVLFQVNKRNSGKGDGLRFLLEPLKGNILYFPIMPPGWDDAISSCRMTGNIIFGSAYANPSTAGMIFFDGPNYTGRSLDFHDLNSGGKHFSKRDYFSSFGFDRITSSMQFYLFNRIY